MDRRSGDVGLAAGLRMRTGFGIDLISWRTHNGSGDSRALVLSRPVIGGWIHVPMPIVHTSILDPSTLDPRH